MAQAKRMNSKLYMHMTAERDTESAAGFRYCLHTVCCWQTKLICLADIPPVMFGDTNSAGLRVSDNPYNNHDLTLWHRSEDIFYCDIY